MTRFGRNRVYLIREGPHIMRQVLCIFVALLCSAAVAGPVRWADRAKAGPIDPMQSAALFVGVRDFTDDHSLTSVPYAVDDAVDLAYELTMVPERALVNPKRVVLSLSGDPQKPESQEKLRMLVAAGALTRTAGQSDIFNLLESQSRSVGPNGIFIAAFATHGVSEEGTQYLLAASSLLAHYRQTSLTDAGIREIVSGNGVPRSLIFIDACRERLTKDKRSGEVDPRSMAKLMRDISGVNGQAVISAAAVGGYAYDDDVRHNGVFTETVIDGLRCGASTNAAGFVTVDTLHSYVEGHVLSWLRLHKDSTVKKATQLVTEGATKQMPLSVCVNRSASASRPRSQ
jgi:hypothetical protein